MSAHLPHRETHPGAATHAAVRLRRITAALAAVTYTLLASAAIMPTAWAAVNYIQNDSPDQAPAGAVVRPASLLWRGAR